MRFGAVAAALVALGAGARLYHYALNFSLNHDDAALALNVMRRDITQLSERLDFAQLAPWGFLALERGSVVLWGASEWALRLAPVAASLSALAAFAYLAWNRLPRPDAAIAIGFLSVSPPVAGAAIQVKQYSMDVLATVVLLIVCSAMLDDDTPLNARSAGAAALAGGVSLWFSFVAAFVLAGIGLASLYRTKSAPRFRALAAIGATWIASGALYAWLVLRHQVSGSQLFAIWSHEFLNGTLTDIPEWLVQRALNVGVVSTSVRLAPACAALLIGAVWLTTRSPRRFTLALALIFAVTLGASAAGWYPFVGRFLFFIAPVVLLLLVGEVGAWHRLQRPFVRRTIAAAAVVALAYSAASFVAHAFGSDPAFDDPRGVYRYVRAHEGERDLVYASGAAMPTLLYYDPVLAERHAPLESWPDRPARIWFVFFWPTEAGFDAEAVKRSGRAAQPVDTMTRKLHRAALWTLSPASRPSGR